MDYRILSVRMWPLYASIYKWRTLEFDSWKISGLAQSLTRNGHPSIWWTHSIIWLSGVSTLGLRHWLSYIALEVGNNQPSGSQKQAFYSVLKNCESNCCHTTYNRQQDWQEWWVREENSNRGSNHMCGKRVWYSSRCFPSDGGRSDKFGQSKSGISESRGGRPGL